MERLTDAFVLNNGYKIPCIGYGTWLIEEGDIAVDTVQQAIKAGYRHIDTAFYYKNEQSVGIAIKKSGIDRKDLFITSKLWNEDRGYESTLKAFEKTIKNLQLEYLDLYLIHWPASSSQFKDWEQINVNTWRAMVELYKQGKIKAIGVSNFMPHHLEALMEFDIKPMVNQIEYHPGYIQEDTIQYCKQHGIQLEAWSPLARGRVLNHEILIQLAQKYKKSTAQICLRFCLQSQVIPLPKSMSFERMKENMDIFDFELTTYEMECILSIKSCGASGLHPDEVVF